jgi:hypothetical protein
VSGPSGSEATKLSEGKPRRCLTLCVVRVRVGARADAIFDVPDMHVLDVEIDDQQRLVLSVESGQLKAACPACGVGGRPWPSGAARCAVLRPGHLSEVVGADLALP